MLRVKDCCCGILSLKTGCLVISIVGIVLGLLWATGLDGVSGGWTAGFVLGIVLEILVWIGLLIGVILNKHEFIGLSLIGLGILILLRIVLFILIVALLAPVMWLLIFYIIFNLAAILLYIYFGIVVNSYYRTLKGGSDPF